MGTGKDATYQADNYEEQGGARWVIGGELDVPSGGQINLESGGFISVDVQTLGSSQVATNVTGEGITTITATTTAPDYTLDPPVAGVQKVIACTADTSSGTAIVSSNSTGVSFTTSGDNTMTFNAINERVILYALSTTAWIIASNVNGVATGTQST